MLKIAIDGAVLLKPLTGVGYYWSGILERLVDKLADDEKLLIYTFYWKNYQNRAIELKKKFGNLIVEKRFPERYIEFISKFYDISKILDNPDIIHYTSLKFPVIKNRKIYTIYDISFLENEIFHLAKVRKKHIMALKKIINDSASEIITISNFTKRQLIEKLQILEKRINVIYPVLNADVKINNYQETELNALLKKYNIRRPFILYNGTIEPRKNIVKMIEAYKTTKAYQNKTQLIITGKYGWCCDEIFSALSEYDKSLIIFTGYIEREELIKLYNSALFFIYISLYEGFGLPVIEAFGCGCPVITSDIEVIKEITDNAALLVNPEDLDDIKTKIDLMYENENIRNNYIKLGLQRAEFYKTDNSVMQLLSLYRKSKL